MDRTFPLLLLAASLILAGCTSPDETTEDRPAEPAAPSHEIGSSEVTGTMVVGGNSTASETNASG